MCETRGGGANTLIVLPLSGHRGHGRTCWWLAPVVNGPKADVLERGSSVWAKVYSAFIPFSAIDIFSKHREVSRGKLRRPRRTDRHGRVRLRFNNANMEGVRE